MEIGLLCWACTQWVMNGLLCWAWYSMGENGDRTAMLGMVVNG